MSTLAGIRAGLAAVLDTIPGLEVHDRYPDTPSCPAAFVIRAGIEGDNRRSVSGRAMESAWTVRVLAGSVEHVETSGVVLDGFVEPIAATGIQSVLRADPTLGGACEHAHVTDVSGDIVSEHAGVAYLAADLTVAVLASFT